MAAIVYSSIPELAHKIKSELSEDELKQLIQKLVKNDLAEFSEYQRDSIAYGTYAPVSKVCSACGRPM